MRLAALLEPIARRREPELAHALRSVPLFRALPSAALVALWRRLEAVRLPAGAVVCERGEPGDRFYILQAGRVEVRLGLDPDGMTLRSLGPGDPFGEMALVTGEPRSADIVVTEDAVLWALDRASFVDLMASSVPLLRALNEYLCGRVALLTLELEELRVGWRMGSSATGGVAGLRFGSYRALEQIGAGGMAVVYSAVHEATDAVAAVKVLPSVWGNAPELRQRLAREADVLQRLDHPNVVRVYEVGAVDAVAGGGCYVAMEWLPNALDRVLRAQYPHPLAPARALTIARGVARALAAVDTLDVVHRDIKPGNIMLRVDGTPVLIDFGLARMRADAAAGRGLTASNMVVGTADYMSPEQVAGDPLDGRSDLYALGVVLYEMLAGYVPFAGRDPLETLRAHLEHTPPPLPPEVPEPARAIVERALQKRADERFRDAEEMAAALAAALAHAPQ